MTDKNLSDAVVCIYHQLSGMGTENQIRALRAAMELLDLTPRQVCKIGISATRSSLLPPEYLPDTRTLRERIEGT